MLDLITALILELLKAEPPEKLHPTVWFGRIIGFLDRNLPGGVISGILPPVITALFAFILAEVPSLIPEPVSFLLSGYLLHTSISIRSMIEHAMKCVEGGRINPNEVRKIVSRDVEGLKEWQMNSAVIESIAENFVDGVLAPLLYYSVFGLPGALIYRAVNTCDAMLGYRTGKYEKFGKVSARLDDIANFLPSRLSLLLYLILSRKAFLCGLRKSPKLNGHSISAMAGLLEVRLEKRGKYRIECGREPEIEDVVRSIRYFKALSGMAVLSALLAVTLV